MHKQLTAEMLMTDAERQKKLATKMFTMTDDKVRMQTLKQFLKTYNYYVSRLLLARVDPFIQSQNKKYLRQLDLNKLQKISNVFSRLNATSKIDFIETISGGDAANDLNDLSPTKQTSVESAMKKQQSPLLKRGNHNKSIEQSRSNKSGLKSRRNFNSNSKTVQSMSKEEIAL